MLRPLCLSILALATLVVPGALEGKGAPNSPYVQSGLGGRFYVKAIPKEAKGEAGTTVVYRVTAEDKDEVVDTYDWYSRRKIHLAWSPLEGKVAVLKVGGEPNDDLSKQPALTFYLGGKLLQQYSIADLQAMGAKLTTHKISLTKRADIDILGAKQVGMTNEYVFVIEITPDKSVSFDILTGKPYVEKK